MVGQHRSGNVYERQDGSLAFPDCLLKAYSVGTLNLSVQSWLRVLDTTVAAYESARGLAQSCARERTSIVG